MFVLTTVEDHVAVAPADLALPALEAITRVIERTYLNKVIHDLGLTVSLHDVLRVDGGAVYPLGGAPRFAVAFRLVVFRPLVGEVLVGRLAGSDKQGLRVSLGFFNDVAVPEYKLPKPSFFHPTEGAWVWKYGEGGGGGDAGGGSGGGGDGGGGDGQDLYFDEGEDIRVRVVRVAFNALPPPPELQHGVPDDEKVGTQARPYVPMEVEASANEEGLGLVSWWQAGDEEEEEA